MDKTRLDTPVPLQGAWTQQSEGYRLDLSHVGGILFKSLEVKQVVTKYVLAHHTVWSHLQSRDLVG